MVSMQLSKDGGNCAVEVRHHWVCPCTRDWTLVRLQSWWPPCQEARPLWQQLQIRLFHWPSRGQWSAHNYGVSWSFWTIQGWTVSRTRLRHSGFSMRIAQWDQFVRLTKLFSTITLALLVPISSCCWLGTTMYQSTTHCCRSILLIG